MLKIKNVTGINKYFLIIYIKLSVFFHYLPEVLNKKLSIKNFIKLLKRLLLFIGKVKDNKFVKIGNIIKLDLYVPGFPSKAFYTACDKFKVFDNKLPCTTVLTSVTSACKFNCEHCYQKNDKGKDVDIDLLVNTINELQDMGIAFYNIEGGDPFLVFDRLKTLCQNIDDRSEIWINSTGDGITLERLEEIKNSNVVAIMFSMHEPEEKAFNKFMGNPNAWETLLRGIEICHKADVGVAINACLKKEDYYNGKLEKVLEKAKELNVCLIQLIVPKSSGGWLESNINPISKNDIIEIKKKINLYNLSYHNKSYPCILSQAIEEDHEHFGCTAGGTDRFYINAKGDVQPCEFLNISFGNIMNENFIDIYNRMREVFKVPSENLMCEEISQMILKAYKKNNLKTLPLTPEISKEIYDNWNRGKETDFYKKINSI